MSSGRPVLRKSLPTLLILTAAIVGAVLLVASRPQTEPPPREEKVWSIAAWPADVTSHTPVLTLYGRVEAVQSSRLTAAIAADVLEVNAEEGQAVAKGQILLRLDDRDARLRLQQRAAELAEIRAQLQSEQTRYAQDQAMLDSEQHLLTLAEREVKRAQRLERDKLTSASRIDEAEQARLRQAIALAQRRLAVEDHTARQARLQAQQEKAEVQHALAQLDVEHSVIRAPFDGRIGQVSASPGDRARSGEVLVSLYARDSLQVRAQIASLHLPAVSSALAAGSPLNAEATLAGKRIHLGLGRLAGEIRADRGGRDALFHPAAAGDELIPGAILPLTLQLPPVADSLALPAEALYGNDRVYTIIDHRLQTHRVERLGETLGAHGDHLLLLSSDDIASGTPVLITHLPNAMEGLKVRIQAEQP